MIEIFIKRHAQREGAYEAAIFGEKLAKGEKRCGWVAYCFVAPGDERGIFIADSDFTPEENPEETTRSAMRKELLRLGFS